MTDEEIEQRAIESGWVKVIDEPPKFGGTFRWNGWRRQGHGIPVGAFREGADVRTWASTMRHRYDHDDRCRECGIWIDYGWANDDQLRKHTLCFTCLIWVARVEGWAGQRYGCSREFMSESGTWYGIGSAKRPSGSNGFGGAWWTVTFPGESPIETCDLWCGGAVPDRFRSRVPQVAEVNSGRRPGSDAER